MDIRVISTGHIFHQVDSKIAQLLLELLPAAVERVEFTKQAQLPAVDPLVPQWGVRRNHMSELFEVVCQICGNEETFSGEPDALSQGVFGGKAKRVPPQEIIDRYRTAVEADKAERAARLMAAIQRGY